MWISYQLTVNCCRTAIAALSRVESAERTEHTPHSARITDHAQLHLARRQCTLSLCKRIRADSHYSSCFPHRSIFVPSEYSMFTMSVMFSHLPEQRVIGGLRLFPSNMQRTATECIFFRYLLIIRISVMITSTCAVGTYPIFSTLRLSVPKSFLSIHCHYTSYLTCNTIPRVYAAILLTFRHCASSI